MCLGPTHKAELDSLWICHHSNFDSSNLVLIQDRPTEFLHECNRDP